MGKKNTQTSSKHILNSFWDVLIQVYKKLILKIMPQSPFRESFKQATKWLKENSEGKDYAYTIPWFLLVGPESSGKTSILRNLGLRQPANHPTFALGVDTSVSWWFFDHGLILDVDGKFFLTEQGLNKQNTWKQLLDSLRSFRVKRPIDGIILTIPASDFVGPTALKNEELRNKADLIAKQLKLAENMLGLTLPLYIVISKSDQVAGFSGFLERLPKNALDQMFGWSNPYDVNEEFSPNWVHEAFLSITGDLTNATFDIFENSDDANYRDDVMLLPTEIEALQTGVSNYLGKVFEVHGYKGHFMLRGIYFTGGTSTKTLVEQGLEEAKGPIEVFKISFLKDLFSKKIFKEFALATPFKNYVVSSNKQINYLKFLMVGLFILSVISFHHGYHITKQKAQELEPYFDNTFRSIVSTKLYEKQRPDGVVTASSDVFLEKQSEIILEMMTQTHKLYIKTPYLPASYVIRFYSNVERAIQTSFDLIIAKSMYERLFERMEQIFKSPLPPSLQADDNQGIENPLTTNEFLTLQGYVNAVQMLERVLDIYQTFQNTPTLPGLAFVIKYLYGFSFSAEYIEDPNALTLSTVKNAYYKPLSLENYKLLAQKRLYVLFMNFLNRTLNPEANYKFVKDLQKALYHIDNRQGILPNLQALQMAINRVKQLKQLLASPDLSWISRPNFNPGNEFEEMMVQLSSIKLFDENFIRSISKEAMTLYQKSQQSLKEYGSPLTGYFFSFSEDKHELTPSVGLQSLEFSVNHFLSQPFMQITSGKSLVPKIPNGYLLYWDSQLVKTSTMLIEVYNHFIEANMSNYAADLQEPFRILARQQLLRNIGDILARAQSFVPLPYMISPNALQNSLTSQINNIKESGPLFLKLLQTLKELNAGPQYITLKNLLFNQVYGLLEKIDTILEQQDFYGSYKGTFNWWQGNENAILQAYQTLDRQELESYLDDQTKQLVTLTLEYALPLLSFLKQEQFNQTINQSKLIDKWSRILKQVNDYSMKKAGNHIQNLSQFLMDEGNKITFANCFKSLSPQQFERPTADFFIQKGNKIRAAMYQQCVALAEKAAVQKFNALASYFNQNLSGNFPFTKVVNPNIIPTAEVRVETIINFFQYYDNLSLVERQALARLQGRSRNWEQAIQFLNQLEQVKTFLDDYFMPKNPHDPPGVNFDIQFRANQTNEVGADQVISWAFVAGNKVVDMQSGQTSGQWNMGEVVSFSFKWAQMSHEKPIVGKDKNPAYLNVDGRVNFLYEGQWSLLRAMMLNQARLAEGATPGDNTLLSFTVPLTSNQLSHTQEGTAVLYIRLKPTIGKGKPPQKFVIPNFPYSAPLLTIDR